MSKNLFDYATKELSQDAFLCWLLENFDDEIIGKTSKKFIQKMMELYTNNPIDASKITKVKTCTQYDHIDIIANVFIDEKRYIFAIEDKVDSVEHDNQLKRYGNSIEKLEGESRYKIYYKTDFIDKNEKERVNAAGWKIFGIDMIYETFKEFNNSNNDVLAYYSKYCIEKYKKMTSISKKSTKEWTLDEWNAWFRISLIPLINKEFDNKIETYIWKYQGKYISIGTYFPERFYDKNKPLIEFFFRPGEDITASIHVETKNGEKYSWSREFFVEAFINEFNVECNNKILPSFKKINTKLCIAKMKNSIIKNEPEEIEINIISIVREFYEFFIKLNRK